MRVLIVEDDPTTATMLAGLLRREGWQHETAEGLAAGWDALGARPFDMLLLDLSLPDGDGVDLLRKVRSAEAGTLPDAKLSVLVISSRSQLRTRLASLDAGADGYITKPVHPDEVAAVIRALSRRRTTAGAGVIEFRDLRVDPHARNVLQGGNPVELSAPEFSVLLALLEARPRALTRADIQARTGNPAGDPGTVEVHVHHLRRKLGERLIQTVRGVGYRIPPDTRRL